jgi:16S rRNA (adenine1518-N6/adenine1519-N6)-dimethyltransferase
MPGQPDKPAEAGVGKRVVAPRRPRKRLGQHFLTDRRILRRIISAARLSPGDTVVEVGAGRGILTQGLAQAAGRVISVEIDEALCEQIRLRLAPYPDVTIVCGDILALPPEELLARASAAPPYVVVANLPYYIASAVLRRFLEAQAPPQRLIVMVQAEVAESMAAQPGRMSLLSVATQFYAQPRVLFYVPPRAFQPPPKVRSAVIQLDVRPQPAVAVRDPDAFFRLVKAGFAAPRKQMRNVLALSLGLEPRAAEALLAAANIDPHRRAQTLAIEEWARLYEAWQGQ